MRLKEKTHRKFVEFFEKMSRMYQGKEFELAYSDIQRDTGTASVTLKRAILSLAEDGVIQIRPGRNSRYAKFIYLLEDNNSQFDNSNENNESKTEYEQNPDHTVFGNQVQHLSNDEVIDISKQDYQTLKLDVQELSNLVNLLIRRVRNQEMTIALLQDRLSELEDKMLKK